MVKNERFSNELDRLLAYTEETAAKDYPTAIITADYFILAILQQKDSFIYQRLYGYLTTTTMEAIEGGYSSFLSHRALSAIRPGREIRFDDKFMTYLIDADIERMKLNAEYITSEHVLLSILNDSESKIKKVFAKAGLTYDILFNRIKDSGENFTDEPKSEENNNDGETKKVTTTLPNGAVINVTGDPSEIMKMFNQGFGNLQEPGMMPPGFEMPTGGRRKGEKDGNIKQFCSNLNDLVEKGEIDPLIGREREINDIIRVLGRRKKNNLVLIGGEGIGKTAIGENLAYKIVNGDVPPFLLDKKVISLDMTALIAGTTLRGMFEGRVKGILDEIKADGNYILFIDNIGNALSDKGKNDYDISSMLSHALENGEVQVVGTADFKSYRSTFDKDPSLSRRFQKIIVEAPSIKDSKDILNGLKSHYESFHNVKYTDEAIDACVDLANRYITERNLPDSAIDIMDESGSFISTSFDDVQEIRDKKKLTRTLRKEIEALKKEDKMDEADAKKVELQKASLAYKALLKSNAKKREENTPIVDTDTILHIISEKTDIPIDNLTADDKKKLATMDERLKEEVVGQDEAITTICKALKRNRVGLHRGKCLYSGILIGKSGIGKTLIAKKLAKEMFGDEKALIRFDMSEYPDKSAVNKLIGSNPGYIGYEEGGQLTETVKNKKHCVLLLDEIEKADPEIYNIFLQVLDEGFLTDNSGMRVDFKNVIVLFTSNIGTKAASDFGKGIGFNENADENGKRILLKQLKNKFPPEFLNRLDNVIYFNNLSDDNLKNIIKIELKKLNERLSEIKYSLEYTDKVVDSLFDVVITEREFGARPINRAIQDNIEDKITDMLLVKEYDEGYVFKADVNEENNITIF